MPRNESSRRGLSGAILTHWRAVLGELLATALLVSLGIAALLPVGGQSPPLAHPALAFGFVIVCLVEVFGGVSGAHMNPSVTLTALLTGHMKPAIAAVYFVAQAVGAILGMQLLLVIAPSKGPLGVTQPGPNVAPIAACLVEALLVFSLALLCCSLWTAPQQPDRTVPIKFGLTVAGLVYSGGELTGASLNPVRSLAPALLQNEWSHQWVYWVGPLGGAALGALLHRWVLCPASYAPRPAPRDSAAPEAVALQDKERC